MKSTSFLDSFYGSILSFFLLIIVTFTTACQVEFKESSSSKKTSKTIVDRKPFENKNNGNCKPVFPLAKVNQFKLSHKIEEKSLFFDQGQFSFYHSPLADLCQTGLSHLYYVPSIKAVGPARSLTPDDRPGSDAIEAKIQIPIQWLTPGEEMQKEWAQSLGANMEYFEINTSFVPLLKQPAPAWIYGDNIDLQKPSLFYDSQGTAILEFSLLKSAGVSYTNFIEKINSGRSSLRLISEDFWENTRTPVKVVYTINPKFDKAQTASHYPVAFSKKILNDLWEKNISKPEQLLKLQAFIKDKLRFEDNTNVDKEFNLYYAEHLEKLWIPRGPTTSNVNEYPQFYVDSLNFIEAKKPNSEALTYLKSFRFLQSIFERDDSSLNESIRLKDELHYTDSQIDALIMMVSQWKTMSREKTGFTLQDLWREALNLAAEESKDNFQYLQNRANIIHWMINSGSSWNEALSYSRETKATKINLTQLDEWSQWLTNDSSGPKITNEQAQSHLKEWLFKNQWNSEKMVLLRQSIDWLLRSQIFIGEPAVNKAHLWVSSTAFNRIHLEQIQSWYTSIEKEVSELSDAAKLLAVAEDFESHLGAMTFGKTIYNFIAWLSTTPLAATSVYDEFTLFYNETRPLDFYALAKESYFELVSSKSFAQKEDVAYRIMKDWVLTQKLLEYPDGLKLLKGGYLWLIRIVDKADAFNRCQVYVFRKKMNQEKFAKLQRVFETKKAESPNDIPKALKAAEDSVFQ